MKKNRVLKTLCLTLAVLSCLAGCNQSRQVDTSNGDTVKLSIISPDNGRINKQDNPIIKEIERLTNTSLEVNLVPSGEFINKLNVMVASNSVADIVRTGSYDFFQYTPQGVFIELSELIDKNTENIKKIPDEVWSKVKDGNGNLYGIPSYGVEGKYITVARKDWLDNVGLDVPENLDDLREMYKRFTYNDPDKNGKDDTFGITTTREVNGEGASFSPETFMNIFGAYGIIPGFYYEEDGKVYPSSIVPKYKEALEYLYTLYSIDKVVDPDLFILKTDQSRQNFVQGRAGSFTGWWSTPTQILVQQLKMNQVNPDSEFVYIPPVKGPYGDYGLRSSGMITGNLSISKNCTESEAAIKFIDWLASDEGARMKSWGRKGIDYIEENGEFMGRTPEGQKGMDEKWLDSLSQLLSIPNEKMSSESYRNEPQLYADILFARDTKVYSDLFEGYSTEEMQKYWATLKAFELESMIKFLTGKDSLDNFDKYTEEWLNKGGKEILHSLTAEYNKRTGKQLQPAY